MKLLRVLQEREFERLGGTRTIKVDVRLVAATNRDLRAALEEGTFRQDLYYRLNVVPIDIPPLREHKEDIPDLANLFLSRLRPKIPEEAGGHLGRSDAEADGVPLAGERARTGKYRRTRLRPHDRPADRAVATSTSIRCRSATVRRMRPLLPEGKTLDQWEDEIIREAYRRANGNKSQAARLLGLSRNALRYRLEKIGIGDEAAKAPQE